jgi:hypothetical protein
MQLHYNFRGRQGDWPVREHESALPIVKHLRVNGFVFGVAETYCRCEIISSLQCKFLLATDQRKAREA